MVFHLLVFDNSEMEQITIEWDELLHQLEAQEGIDSNMPNSASFEKFQLWYRVTSAFGFAYYEHNDLS